jgi:hypothetical protein
MNDAQTDKRRTKEAKALSTWKSLIYSHREEMNLDEFTAAVNQCQGGDYAPYELRKILKELQIATTPVPS